MSDVEKKLLSTFCRWREVARLSFDRSAEFRIMTMMMMELSNTVRTFSHFLL